MMRVRVLDKYTLIGSQIYTYWNAYLQSYSFELELFREKEL